MTQDDRELGDDRLRAELRVALGRPGAPRSWVRDALEIPARHALPAYRSPRPLPAAPRPPAPGAASVRRPGWVALLPHLAGVALLGGLALAWILRPEMVRAALEPAVRALEENSRGPQGPGPWTLAGLLAPLVVLFIVQGASGFPILRRLHLLR